MDVHLDFKHFEFIASFGSADKFAAVSWRDTGIFGDPLLYVPFNVHETVTVVLLTLLLSEAFSCGLKKGHRCISKNNVIKKLRVFWPHGFILSTHSFSSPQWCDLCYLKWVWRFIYKMLPWSSGQVWVLQDWYLTLCPTQYNPPFCGTGEVHSRWENSTPPPHVREHSPQGPHSPHPPLTGTWDTKRGC